MKRCPSCEKTFDDSMRFCQADGTPLVADEPALDPFKTMVARPEDLAPAAPIPTPKPPENDVLQIPSDPDPLKTMYASEEEIRSAMASSDAEKEQLIDLPPLEPASTSAAPISSPPSFGDAPPSPFSGGIGQDSPPPAPEPPIARTSPPIPSPFNEPPPAAELLVPDYQPDSAPEPPKPDFRPYSEPEPPPVVAAPNPFDPPASPSEWAPPEPQWQNPAVVHNPGMNMQSAGQNQTLAIVSLVLGIVSIVFCQITGPVAIVTGFMARRKASENPAEYGGAGLGLAGIITGAIGTLLLVLVVLYFIFVFGVVGLSIMGN